MSVSPEEQEIRIVQHWFRNWSESQRQHFLQFLIKQIQPDVSDLVNGLQSLTFFGQSPTTFECQLRQFSLWFDNWSFQGKKAFRIKLLEVDPNFVSLLSQNINQ